jgi:hypothetical protein
VSSLFVAISKKFERKKRNGQGREAEKGNKKRKKKA